MDNILRLRKPLVLGMALLLGGTMAAVAPALWHRFAFHAAAGEARPLLSVQAAQRQVPFRILVPATRPVGSRLDGVRVGQVVLANPAGFEAQRRANTRPMSGFGVALGFDASRNRISVRAHNDSPAAKAGLSTSSDSQLVMVNGYQPLSAKREEALVQEYVRLLKANDPRSEILEQKVPSLLYRMKDEPLRLVVKGVNGQMRTVVIPRRGNWTFRPDPWPGDPAGNRAALLFSRRGKQWVLHEHRSVPKERPVIPPKSKRVRMSGTDVWLSGPPERPTAYWQRGGVAFLLDNYQLALDRGEVLSTVESLVVPKTSTNDHGKGASGV